MLTSEDHDGGPMSGCVSLCGSMSLRARWLSGQRAANQGGGVGGGERREESLPGTAVRYSGQVVDRSRLLLVPRPSSLPGGVGLGEVQRGALLPRQGGSRGRMRNSKKLYAKIPAR